MTHIQTTCPNRIALRAGKKAACPAKVGVLVSVFEKSATELNLKQKLQKSKHTIQIATFNVRTLNRIGQLPLLTASAIDHNRHNMQYKNIDTFIAKISNITMLAMDGRWSQYLRGKTMSMPR